MSILTRNESNDLNSYMNNGNDFSSVQVQDNVIVINNLNHDLPYIYIPKWNDKFHKWYKEFKKCISINIGIQYFRQYIQRKTFDNSSLHDTVIIILIFKIFKVNDGLKIFVKLNRFWDFKDTIVDSFLPNLQNH